ncbi:MAG: hypothetical protein B6I20_10880 [Bacteroidetes bacterium 4572_117]|nr:MAG: hypothetical protein B6I20_10880 [Bacteroidetes bacterium 4572_117]
MKNLTKQTLAMALVLLISACTNENTQQKEDLNVPPVKTGAFYETDLDSSNSVLIADSIIYDVVIKNAFPEDEWSELCLKYVDRTALANIIFNAIYSGRLTAYDYQNEIAMTIEEVKELEKENSRDKIAKIQFIEEWYMDEKEMKMGKRVNEIMLAYELNNDDGEVRGYRAGVKVFLTNESMNPSHNKPRKDID